MEGTLLDTDVSAYVNAAWTISVLLIGAVCAWAILSWQTARKSGEDE